MTILKTNSLTNSTKELHITEADGVVYVDFHELGSTNEFMTISAEDWEAFVLAEHARLITARLAKEPSERTELVSPPLVRAWYWHATHTDGTQQAGTIDIPANLIRFDVIARVRREHFYGDEWTVTAELTGIPKLPTIPHVKAPPRPGFGFPAGQFYDFGITPADFPKIPDFKIVLVVGTRRHAIEWMREAGIDESLFDRRVFASSTAENFGLGRKGPVLIVRPDPDYVSQAVDSNAVRDAIFLNQIARGE